MILRRRLWVAAIAAVAIGISSNVRAADFHGFDPTGFQGEMLSATALKAMAADAMATTKPHNGHTYVFGFANLERDIPFGIRVEQSIRANAEAAGIHLLVADNRLDGPTALANAESFVRRNADFVIEFQTDVNFGQTIMRQFDNAKVPVIAIDIPMPGATFFGANNPRSGFMGGSYLGEAAIAKFGAGKVDSGYLVVGDLPQSGAIPAMRTGGEAAGFAAVVPTMKKSHIIKIDTKNTMQYSFQQMSDVLGRIPPGVPILITAINDQATLGMLRAVYQAHRERDAIAVGMGADEAPQLAKEKQFVASVGYFPERYGNYLIPMALMALAGHPLPPAVLVHHVMVTQANVCKFYPKVRCGPAPGFTYQFPEKAFLAYLAYLHRDPMLAGYEKLIPAQ